MSISQTIDPNVARLQSAVDELRAGRERLLARVAEIEPAARAALEQARLPRWLEVRIGNIMADIARLGQQIGDKVLELLAGAAAPFMTFRWAWQWMEVRGLATGVASQMRPEFLAVDGHWKGLASEAYVRTITPQANAASRIGAVAQQTAVTLVACGTAGIALYLAVAVIVVKFIAVAIASVGIVGMGLLGALAGLAMIWADAKINLGLLLSALAAFTAFIGAQFGARVFLHGDAVDRTALPGGRWPIAGTAGFSDATVLDGDADWSVEV
jgi:hypothetical protein